jgi:hypothetical protein
MKNVLKYLIGAFSCIALIAHAVAAADFSVGGGFKSKAEEVKILKPKEIERLNHIRAQKGHKRTATVELDALAINSNILNVSVSPERKITLILVRRENLPTGAVSWVGKSVDRSAEGTFTVENGMVDGVVRDLGKVYEFKSLSGKLHAVTDVDFGELPPEHPLDKPHGAKDSLPNFSKLGAANRSDGGVGNTSDQQSSTATSLAADIPANAPAIDVLIAYTPKAASFFGNVSSSAQTAISQMNQSFANSGISLQVKLAGTIAVNADYANSTAALNALTSMPNVKAMRNTVKADVVVMFAEFSDSCGLANSILATPTTAYAVVADNCVIGNLSMAHEIGHLLGARHNPDVDPSTTPYAYGHGFYHYVYSNTSSTGPCFHTIMSYAVPTPPTPWSWQGLPYPPPSNFSCTSDPRINYWSSPALTYAGWPIGRSSDMNNTAVLNATGGAAASFGNTGISTLTTVQLISTIMGNLFVLDN